jgi:hypothetical protein
MRCCPLNADVAMLAISVTSADGFTRIIHFMYGHEKKNKTFITKLFTLI